MLNCLGRRILQTRAIPALVTPVRCLKLTASLLRKDKEDYRKPMDCPETIERKCKDLFKKPCSPTDPSVRPCSEGDCVRSPRYPCCVDTSISKNPCTMSGKKKDFKLMPEPFVSMWENYKGKKGLRPEILWHYPPECCPKCEDVRFDVLYYKPSNKCRTYQRTWWECCPRMVPKRVCCWCDAVPPQVLRRELPICPRSACTNEHEAKRMDCMNKKAKGCQRLRMPCCRASRVPPDCHIVRTSSNCKKVKCPYPSFSECIQDDLAVLPERPPECKCPKGAHMCEQFAYAEYLAKHNISVCPCPTCKPPRV